MINGIIVVKKEAGFTSFDVVAKLRGILKQKKIGHTGTLDPDATGVLPVCLGSATKLCDMLTDKKKEYIAEFVLGKTTDTQDISGKILKITDDICGEAEVRDAIMSFVGNCDQVPPMYSALKVDGKRLYELAREGKEIERKSRPVTFYEIEILGVELPYVKIRVVCSKGTYIRTLCHDIGQKLGCGATMTMLQRTMSGQYKLEQALTLSEIEKLQKDGELAPHIMDVDDVFQNLPALTVENDNKKRILNGNLIFANNISLPKPYADGQQYRIYGKENGMEELKFMAIYSYSKEKHAIVPEKMFL